MPLLPFETCRHRIARAEAHHEAFAALWNEAISEGDLYSTCLNIQDDGTGSIWIAPRFEGGLPDAFSLEFGEFLYQLRSALDACVYAAAIVDSRQDPPPDDEHLEFPICASRASFKNASRKIRPLAEERRRIIESVQPYNAPPLDNNLLVLNPHRTLAILNDWARKDRHRKLHIVGGWASNANPQLRLPDGVELEYMMVVNDGLLEHDSEIASFKVRRYVPGSEPKIQANPDLFIDIAIDEPPPMCADNDTLDGRTKSMIVWVKATVREIEASFSEYPPRVTRIDAASSIHRQPLQ
ncbi:MAG: hypothetical protein MUP14_00695 [Dehalococcoidia bacterium]|nr:hypothetical protein [Dehalococcoidia bacterium]